MKNAVILTGHVLVSDVVAALEGKIPEDVLDRLDEALKGRPDDERIDFDNTEVLAEAAIDALDEAGKLPEPESISDELNQGDVQDLAAAIHRGDTAEAELLLDRLFHDATVAEWVQRGRYGPKARAVVEAARIAA